MKNLQITLILSFFSVTFCKSNQSIYDIDFNNFTYPEPKEICLSSIYSKEECPEKNQKITVKDGQKIGDWNLGGEDIIKVNQIIYNDFNNDGLIDALIDLRLLPMGASYSSYCIPYIYTFKENKTILLNQFALRPIEMRNFDFLSSMGRWYLRTDKNKIILGDDLYLGKVARCCPKYGVEYIGEYINYNEILWTLKFLNVN